MVMMADCDAPGAVGVAVFWKINTLGRAFRQSSTAPGVRPTALYSASFCSVSLYMSLRDPGQG